MGNAPEVVREVGVYDVRMTTEQQLLHLYSGLLGVAPGIIRLQRYYEPLRHPRAPGLSLTGIRLIIPDHVLGLPVLRALSLCTCCRHYPGAAAGALLRSFPQPYQPSPKG